VNEKDLGNVKPGMTASVVTDTHPNTPIEGTVGYISSVSEFTPKTVETPDLRSSLVYEVRVIVKDPKGDLRLGQPATVKINLNSKGAEIPASTAAAVSQVPDTPPSAAPAAN
jgi:HlyD family secretion protein